MKKTKTERQQQLNRLQFQCAKWRAWLCMKAAPTKLQRQRARNSYNSFRESATLHNVQNGLPDGIYCRPTQMLLYDLIPKQKRKQVEKGLNQLYRYHLTHRYMVTGKEKENISKILEHLDQTIWDAKSWCRVGIFDFAGLPKLDRNVEHIEINLKNFSSSYMAVEILIYFSQTFRREMESLMGTDYQEGSRRILKWWAAGPGKSGAKTAYAIGYPNQELIKCSLIYERLQAVKIEVLARLVRYLPLWQASARMPIYGLNVFETNLEPCRRRGLQWIPMRSLGLDEGRGFFLSEAERLYIATALESQLKSRASDMMLLFNPSRIERWEGYCSPADLVLSRLTMDYMELLGPVMIINSVGLNHYQAISRYRNRINQIRMNSRSQKKLLRLKYELEETYYTYTKLSHEYPVAKQAAQITEQLKQNPYVQKSVDPNFPTRKPYLNFATGPAKLWALVETNYQELLEDLNRKIEIATSLHEYHDTFRNKQIAIAQVLLAVATFGLLIFPEKAKELAQLANRLLEFLP